MKDVTFLKAIGGQGIDDSVLLLMSIICLLIVVILLAIGIFLFSQAPNIHKNTQYEETVNDDVELDSK